MGHFAITFSPPSAGWLQVEVRAGRAVALAVSHVPYPSLQELSDAVGTFLESGRRSIARMNSEPDEYDLVLERGASASALRLSVVEFSRGLRTMANEREVFTFEGDSQRTGRTIWRALRQLESRFEASQWREPFPAKSVETLGHLLGPAA